MTDFLLNIAQWPAMLATLISAWLVASQSKRKRWWGFGIFIVSNILWMLWGVYTAAYAVVTLQVGLLFLNIRGAIKND